MVACLASVDQTLEALDLDLDRPAAHFDSPMPIRIHTGDATRRL